MQITHELNLGFDNSCSIAFQQLLKDSQLILMTDASFNTAGQARMNRDTIQEETKPERKANAPVTCGSKTFNPGQSLQSI